MPMAVALAQLPAGSQIGATRVGGIDLNRPRMRNALTAVLALAVATDEFTVADPAAKVRSLTGHDEHQYTVRQAAYDLRKNPRETPRRQTRADPPLPRPRPGRPGDRRPAHVPVR